MANEWQELAVTMRDTLLEACASEESLRLIDHATTKLQALAEVLQAIRLGATYAEAADAYVDPEPVGVRPATLLQDARLDIKRRSTLHGQATSVLLLCCTGMNLEVDPDAEMAQRCVVHSSDANGSAADALVRLRNAASFAKTAIDALDIAGALDDGVLLQRAWLLAAEQMENAAIDEVTQARNDVVAMREALSLQLFDSLSILGMA